MDIIHILDNATFFKGVSTKSKEMLAEICLPKNVTKKQVLFNEGDLGLSVYVVGKGAVALSTMTDAGKESVIKIIQPGEIFGEVILFERNDYPVTATVIKPGIVYLMPRQKFNALLATEVFRTDFIRMLMRKQRYLAQRVQQLSSSDVRERLFAFLIEQSQGKAEFYLNLPKKEIAAAIGTTPETLSRLILACGKERVFSWKGKIVKLLRTDI